MYQKDINLKAILNHFNEQTERQFANLLFGSIVVQAAIEAEMVDRHVLIKSVLVNNHKPGENDVDVILCGDGAVSAHLSCKVDDYNQIYRFIVNEDSIKAKPVAIKTSCKNSFNGEVEVTPWTIMALICWLDYAKNVRYNAKRDVWVNPNETYASDCIDLTKDDEVYRIYADGGIWDSDVKYKIALSPNSNLGLIIEQLDYIPKPYIPELSKFKWVFR